MHDLVRSTVELAESVHAFMEAPEYWRDAIGSHPKYFVHVEDGAQQLFGLSKFCAFRDISLEDYVAGKRKTISGGDTQRHISRICGKEWKPLKSMPRRLKKKFRNWFNLVTDEKITIDNIYLLTVDLDVKRNPRINRIVSPEDLQRQLLRQTKIGQVGEKIALAYEKARLISLGATKVNMDLRRVSLENTAAGFDIRSEYKRNIRYIEVKSSTSIVGKIYVTTNEISTLQKHGKLAYLYIVHVADVKKCIGTVVRELQNPFASGQKTVWIRPALFTGEPPIE